MIWYDYMHPQFLKGKKRNEIIKLVKDKYNIPLSRTILEKDRKVLIDFLNEQIFKKNIKEKFSLDNMGVYLDDSISEEMRKQFAIIIVKISEILLEPDNYYGDLLWSIYYGLIYNSPTSDTYGYKINVGTYKNEIEKAEIKEFKIDIENKKTEISSAWLRKSNDNKINKDCVRKNYPVSIVDEVDYEGNRIIRGIPGGCFYYHHTMLSVSNIGIFDLETLIDSYKRYSFPRAYEIYNTLKEYSVENLLLMESTLGYSYTNQLFSYFKKIQDYHKISSLSDFIVAGAEIKQFFIRSKIIDCILKVFDVEEWDEKLVNVVTKIINFAESTISEIFSYVLEVWWYEYYLFGNDNDLYLIRLQLNTLLEQYNRKYDVYGEWVSNIGISDWRNIKTVQDCFVRVDQFQYSEKQYKRQEELLDYYNGLAIIPINDLEYNLRYLYIENYANEVGRNVLENTIKILSKLVLPDDEKQLYQLYYQIRDEQFKILKEREQRQFNECDIKIRDSMKKVNYKHIYGIFHQMIIETLLLNIRSLRKF